METIIYPLRALCFSDKCSNRKGNNQKPSATGGVEKRVSRSQDFCPDCASALYWTREDRNSVEKHYAVRSNRKVHVWL
jgi:hypothetical protein